MSKKKTKLLIFDFLLFALLIGIDQITKYYAVIKLKDKPAFSIIEGVFEFNYLENRGAAFGMLQNQKFFFVIVSAIVLLIIIFVLFKTPDHKKYNLFHILLVGIAAGAVGNNLIDRLFLDYVIDFISVVLINFPIFNMADTYVCVATFILAILLLFVYKEEDLEFLSFQEKKYREIKDDKK